MPRKEKYVEWTTISIPKEIHNQIRSYLKSTRQIPSVSNFIVLILRKYLKRFMEEEKEQKIDVQINDEEKEAKKEINIKKIDKGSNIIKVQSKDVEKETKKNIKIKRFDIGSKFVKVQTRGEEKKSNKDIKKIKVVKSSKFVECRNLLLSARNALQKNDKNKAMKLYKQAKVIYSHLGYNDEQKLYKEFMEFYNKFKFKKI